jgi:xanthine/uracil/vitamin C permease (AzgA family)
MNQKILKLQKFFRVEARGSTVGSEVKVGISVAFLSMFVVLNSVQLILKASGANENQLLIPLISIALLFSALLTIFGGIYTRLPLLFLSTIGFNFFVVNKVISALSLDWGIGLGVIVIESFLFILLAFTKLPTGFFSELPEYIKKAAPMTIGGILIFFSLLSAKVITFKGSSELSTLTFRSGPLILFAIGLTVTYFLVKEKASFAILQGFFLTLLLGMIIPTFAQGLAFYLPVILLSVAFILWMLLYSILVDKHNKKSFEVSLWVIMVGLLVIVIFHFPMDPIIAKPLHWFGKLGLFGLPQFKEATAIIGYPIFNLKGVFNQFPKLIVPILSLLSVHWIAYYSFVEVLNGYMHFKKHEQELYFDKKAVATEGAIGLLGSASGTGFFSGSLGSIFSLLLGGKTAIVSVVSGITFLVFLFLIPLFSKSFVSIAFAPALFYFGIKLIVDFIPLSMGEKSNWIPILVCLVIGTLTMSIYSAFLVSLISYIYLKIAEGKLNEISNLTWILVFLFFVWSFVRIPFPYIVLSI